MSTKKIVTSIIALALIASSLVAISKSSHAVATDRMNNYTQKSLDRYRIPGASAIIQKDGQTVLDASWGETSRGDKVTGDTPFLIGSLSKSMTAAAILMLVQDGKINPNEPISAYIPDFHYVSIDNTQTTVRHLLLQTSGISPMDGLNVTDREYPNDDGIMQAVGNLKGITLLSKPGDQYRYTSANYLLLGAIIQSVSGQPFAEFLERQLFDPLKMKNTSADRAGSLADGLQPGYDSWLGYPIGSSGFYDAAGAPYGYISSTANDMTKFLKLMQAGGSVLDEQRMQLLRQVPASDRTYGFGWHYSKDGKYFYHGGATPGFRAEMFCYPDRVFSGIILTNKYHSLEDQQVSDIMAGIRAIADGQNPPALPAADRSIQLGIAGVLVTLIVSLTVMIVRYFRYRTYGRIWKKVIGAILIVVAIGFVSAVPYIFGAPWHSALLFAADVGYMSILLSILLAINGMVLFLNQRQKSSTGKRLRTK